MKNIKFAKYQRGFAWAPVIAAGISAVGSFIGGKKRNEAQIASAREQMDFQKEMSDTAHQREVLDLRAAGLNPILSATGGRGASSPGGAQANIQDVVTPALSTAQQAARLSAEMKNIVFSNKKLKSEDWAIRQGAAESIARQRKSQEETQQLKLYNQMLRNAGIPASKLDAKIWDGEYGQMIRYLQKFNPFGKFNIGGIGK